MRQRIERSVDGWLVYCACSVVIAGAETHAQAVLFADRHRRESHPGACPLETFA